MDVKGKKVRVRDRVAADSLKEDIWIFDPEITSLDVPAGKIFNNQRFSIETLDGKHIGSCSLYNKTQSDVQIGIRIGDKSCWGKGYGTEAVSILVDHCFSTMDVDRIWLKVLPQNLRAIKCYDKCGFDYCGRLALDGYDFMLMERTVLRLVCSWCGKSLGVIDGKGVRGVSHGMCEDCMRKQEEGQEK